MCVCVHPHCNFCKTWCRHCSIGRHPSAILLDFQQSVITTWQKCKLVRWRCYATNCYVICFIRVFEKICKFFWCNICVECNVWQWKPCKYSLALDQMAITNEPLEAEMWRWYRHHKHIYLWNAVCKSAFTNWWQCIVLKSYPTNLMCIESVFK